jgi:hypothetical protein
MGRAGIEQLAKSTEKAAISKPRGADYGAPSGDSLAKYPDLTALDAAWPTLPDETRKRIMELAKGGK